MNLLDVTLCEERDMVRAIIDALDEDWQLREELSTDLMGKGSDESAPYRHPRIK